MRFFSRLKRRSRKVETVTPSPDVAQTSPQDVHEPKSPEISANTQPSFSRRRPLSIRRKSPRKATSTIAGSSSDTALLHKPKPSELFGHLAIYPNVTISSSALAYLLDTAGEALITRGGVYIPSLFLTSTLVDPSDDAGLYTLVTAFLEYCLSDEHQRVEAESKWKVELEVTKVVHLAICIRWACARWSVLLDQPDIHAGQAMATVDADLKPSSAVEWMAYLSFRSNERNVAFEPRSIAPFLQEHETIAQLLKLLTRVTAFAKNNGCTPTLLSQLFGYTIFTNVHSTLNSDAHNDFRKVYTDFIMSSNAFEHLLLAYIRYQEVTELDKGQHIAATLKSWTVNYVQSISSALAMPSSGSTSRQAAFIQRHVPKMSVHPIYGPLNKLPIMVTDVKKPPLLSSRYKSILKLVDEDMQVPGVSHESDDWSHVVKDFMPRVEEELGDRLKFNLNESAQIDRSQSPGDIPWSKFQAKDFTFGLDVSLEEELKFDEPLVKSVSDFTLDQDSYPKHSVRKLRKPELSDPRNAPQITIIQMVDQFLDIWADIIMATQRSETVRRKWIILELLARNDDTVYVVVEEVLNNDIAIKRKQSIFSNERRSVPASTSKSMTDFTPYLPRSLSSRADLTYDGSETRYLSLTKSVINHMPRNMEADEPTSPISASRRSFFQRHGRSLSFRHRRKNHSISDSVFIPVEPMPNEHLGEAEGSPVVDRSPINFDFRQSDVATKQETSAGESSIHEQFDESFLHSPLLNSGTRATGVQEMIMPSLTEDVANSVNKPHKVMESKPMYIPPPLGSLGLGLGPILKETAITDTS